MRGFKMKVYYLFVYLFLCGGANAKDEPRFLGSSTNVTVVESREATLVCKVENLNKHKVAWLRVDTQTILTIGPHVITKNHRVGVAHRDLQLWVLTLRDVRPSDGGQYMCQINTEPMITQTHNLQVNVPPDILDSSSSGEVMVREGDEVSLHCLASGTPPPTVTWRREDSKSFPVRHLNVTKWSGVWLNMSEVGRELNGAYLCIASNGVPPTVSKRVILQVLCGPTVWASEKALGGYLGSSVLLQCMVEANPAPVVYWTHSQNRLSNGQKYQSNMNSDGYKHIALLHINNITREDIGTYTCHVDNTRADIVLYTLVTNTLPATELTTTTTAKYPVTFQHIYYTTTTTTILPNREVSSNVANADERVVLSQQQMQTIDVVLST